MTTLACRIIENAGRPRSDEERRAMFAHMRRGAITASAEAYADPAAPKTTAPPGETWWQRQQRQSREEVARIRRSAAYKANEAAAPKMEDIKKANEALDKVQNLMALASPAGLRTRGAATAVAAGLGGASVAEYRAANPTMDPRKERKLAKVQTLAEIVAALSGLRAGKTLTRSAAPKLTAALGRALAALGTRGERIGAAVAARTPAIVRTPAAKLKAAYDAIAKYTGSEIHSLAQVGDAARFLASGRLKDAAKALVAPALAGATAAGVTGYEEAKIARYQRAIEDQWKKGEDYVLDPDAQPLPPLLQAIIGSTGNPVEKIAVRLPVGGKFTKDLADIAAYQAAWDGIQKARELGTITSPEADAALAKAAERKPWNMAGSGLHAIQPAAAGLIRYAAGSLADDLATARAYGTVADNPERDADTIMLTDGTSIRLLGGDATEIAHAGKPGSKDQPWSREATAASKRLAGPGDAVRYVAGGPADEIGAQQQDGFEIDQPKYQRRVAYVERIPSLVAKVPGLRRVWPGTDVNKALLASGDMQPRYDFMADAHKRLKDYHAAAAEAQAAGRGLYAPDVQKALEKGGLYRWKPTAKDQPAEGQGISKAMNIGGTGLLVSGNSGLFRALGEKTGRPAAQAWNAALAIGGAAQNVATGPKNKGKTYKPPKGYPTAADERRAARRRKTAAP